MEWDGVIIGHASAEVHDSSELIEVELKAHLVEDFREQGVGQDADRVIGRLPWRSSNENLFIQEIVHL